MYAHLAEGTECNDVDQSQDQSQDQLKDNDIMADTEEQGEDNDMNTYNKEQAPPSQERQHNEDNMLTLDTENALVAQDKWSHSDTKTSQALPLNKDTLFDHEPMEEAEVAGAATNKTNQKRGKCKNQNAQIEQLEKRLRSKTIGKLLTV